MNKKLKNYFEGLGLVVAGNNAYGTLNGYEVSANVVMLDTVAPVKMHVNLYATNEVKEKMVKEIRSFGFKTFVIEADAFGILLGFNDVLTVGRLLVRMPDMISKIFTVFRNNEALGSGYCPICGEVLKEESKKYTIGWSIITMDNDCVKGINEEIASENEEFKYVPNNYLKGTCGALLGALVGVVVFVILFYIGYVTSLTAFISILLGSYLYKKLDGKPNGVMVAIVSTISIASMLLAVFGIYVLAAQALAPSYGYLPALESFTKMMRVAEFKQEFLSNLFMTLLFTVIGSVYEIVRLSKTVKRQGTIN